MRSFARAYADFDYKRIFAALNAFMTVDLSAFYFDIRKDALYCDPYSSVTRKACLTVLDHLFRCTVTWLAPMLCFTAEEAWLARDPCRRLGPSRSCFRDGAGRPGATTRLAEKWRKVREVRRVVTGALEIERAAKRIGSSLEAAADRPRRRSGAVRRGGRRRPCRSVHHLGRARWSKARGRPTAFRLDDVPGVAVEPRRAAGPQMRPLVEDFAGGRARSAISRRDAARCPGAARMGRHAQGGGVGARMADAAQRQAGPLLRLGAAERARACRRGGHRASSTRRRSFGCCTCSISPSRARVALAPFLDLVLTWNTGISYGLFPAAAGSSALWALLAFKVAAVVLLWIWLARASSRLTAAGARPDHRRGARQRDRPAALAGRHGFCAVSRRDRRLELPTGTSSTSPMWPSLRACSGSCMNSLRAGAPQKRPDRG